MKRTLISLLAALFVFSALLLPVAAATDDSSTASAGESSEAEENKASVIDWNDNQTKDENGNYTFDNAYGYVFKIESVNSIVLKENAIIFTDEVRYRASLPQYGVSILLAPTSEENVYKVQKSPIVRPDSADKAIEAGINFENGNIVLVVMSSGDCPPASNWEAKVASVALGAGDKVTLSGIDLEKGIAKKATVTVQDAPKGYKPTNGVEKAPSSTASAEKPTWIAKLKKTFIEGERYKWLLDGLKNTMIITFGALIIGVLIGAVIAIAKYFCEGNKKLFFVNWICDLYTTVIRGIPITVLLLAFFYIILVSAKSITVAIIAFGINSGAYMAELIRSGINAVDKGQMEAARSLGLSKGQAMWKIILPQAIKNILPAIGNECIALLKETSVAGYVAIVDLTRAANNIRNKTFDAVNPIIVLALMYLIIVVVMTKLLAILERRLRRSDGKK